jgi:hypothetical protein
MKASAARDPINKKQALYAEQGLLFQWLADLIDLCWPLEAVLLTQAAGQAGMGVTSDTIT